MTLGTSMAAIFGVEELTGRAFNINSDTFRSVEIFSLNSTSLYSDYFYGYFFTSYNWTLLF